MSIKTDNFISELAPIARAEYQSRNKWVLPSVCIAQAALESGWNINAKTLFGIKGPGNTLDTREYLNDKMQSVSASFRRYPNAASAVHDYYDLITSLPRYSGAVNNGDPASAVDAIAKGGYATDPGYSKKVKSIITRYNLRQYDTRAADIKTHYTVNVPALRVRDRASTAGRIVGVWRAGTQFDAVESMTTGNQVWARSIYGWVCVKNGIEVYAV